MTTSALFLVLAAFLASAVEAVEALTVVLALGVTRGWRAPLVGTGVALFVLAVAVAILGPSLSLLPMDTMRAIVGTLLLVFGLQWLRKAILRAGGYKSLRDEDALYQANVANARSAAADVSGGMDWYGFAVAFKSMLLEGLEVAFIVLTFGTMHGSVPLAVAGAGIALLTVIAIGAFAHRPLSRVPENSMKLAVGLMLTTFGIFWSGEGAGVIWPGADLAIAGILAFVTLSSFAFIGWLRGLRELEPALPANLFTEKE